VPSTEEINLCDLPNRSPSAHAPLRSSAHFRTHSTAVRVRPRLYAMKGEATLGSRPQDVSELARAFLQERGLEAAVAMANSSHVAGEYWSCGQRLGMRTSSCSRL
jgi:hypothetical protein